MGLQVSTAMRPLNVVIACGALAGLACCVDLEGTRRLAVEGAELDGDDLEVELAVGRHGQFKEKLVSSTNLNGDGSKGLTELQNGFPDQHTSKDTVATSILDVKPHISGVVD